MLTNRPVLIAPRFGLDDSAHSDFDATLVLATMMSSQLRGADESTGQARDAANQNSAGPSSREGSQGRATSHDSARRGNGLELTPGSAHRSDETAIWSDLSGSSKISHFLHMILRSLKSSVKLFLVLLGSH